MERLFFQNRDNKPQHLLANIRHTQGAGPCPSDEFHLGLLLWGKDTVESGRFRDIHKYLQLSVVFGLRISAGDFFLGQLNLPSFLLLSL